MDATDTFRDERLELIFTCCHPALALDVTMTALTKFLPDPRPRDR